MERIADHAEGTAGIAVETDRTRARLMNDADMASGKGLFRVKDDGQVCA
jgi:hypothetical protein